MESLGDSPLAEHRRAARRLGTNWPQAITVSSLDHVHRVAQEVLTKSEIVKKVFDEGKLTIIEAYYSLDTGEVTKLH